MNTYEQLDAWIDAHFDEQVRFLQELIRVPTDTPPGNYAPHAELRLNADAPREGEAYLGFGRLHAQGPWTLSATGDLVEAAASLFGLLHEIDATGVARIAVAPIPHTGLGEAINDRLLRAAAPRDAS